MIADKQCINKQPLQTTNHWTSVIEAVFLTYEWKTFMKIYVNVKIQKSK
jgi:hypothetical protein